MRDQIGMKERLRDLGLPMFVGGIARLLAAILAPLAPQWDGAIYVRGAEQLAAGGGYTTAILAATVESPKATAFYPVGFPAVLAAVRLLGGDRRTDLLLQAVFGIATIALVYLLARSITDRRTGRVAAWIMALSPGAILYTTTWLAEPAVALGILLALLPLVLVRRAGFVRSLVAFGFVMGLTAYLRVTPLVITPLVAFGIGYGRIASATKTRRLRAGVVAAAIATTAALVPLVPWTLRNMDSLGGPALVSTNGGLNLLMGTLDEGGFQRIDEAIDCRGDVPELELDRCRSARAIDRIRHDPLAWSLRGVNKLWHTFGHESAPAQHLMSATNAVGGHGDRLGDITIGTTRVTWLLILAFAFAGARSLWRREGGRTLRAKAIVFGPIVGLAMLHVVFIGGDRYHASVAPLFAVLAAYGWTHRERGSHAHR